MDKEALVNIILSDLSEIETMVKSFRGQGEIPKAFIELTEKKTANLLDEFVLLKSLNNNSPLQAKGYESTSKTPDISLPPTPPVTPFVEKTNAPAPPATQSSPPQPIQNPAEGTKFPVENEEVEESMSKVVKPEEVLETEITEKVKSKNNVSVIVEPKIEASIKTIGESFGGDKNSVNDLIAKTQQPNDKKSLKGKPIGDLTKGLGINDRFMFQRELFSGKAEVMNQTLQQINQMPDLNSALSFLQSNFDWDKEQEITKAFLSYIERKF